MLLYKVVASKMSMVRFAALALLPLHPMLSASN